MLEQVLLAMVTSAGSAILAWYLCRQYMAAEAGKREEQLKERQRRAERQAASLKAKLEVRVLHARLEEARGMALLLARQLPAMMADGTVSAESPMTLATSDVQAARELSQVLKQVSLMPVPTRRKLQARTVRGGAAAESAVVLGR